VAHSSYHRRIPGRLTGGNPLTMVFVGDAQSADTHGAVPPDDMTDLSEKEYQFAHI
jgi:hypothetical protein